MAGPEWHTRKRIIDRKLRSLSEPWEIVPYRPGLDTSHLSRHAVEEYPTRNGPADYALFVGGKLLGLLEAKKTAVSPQNVLEQAKRYAQGATDGPGNWNGYRVPFLFSSNGEGIWFADVRDPKYVSRPLAQFFTRSALADLFTRNDRPARDWLLDTPIEQLGRKLRPYQHKAIAATEKAILANRSHLLVAMATGTGKTFLTVCQVYRLMKSGLCRRVLFLVDRKALAAQAVREFASFRTPGGNKFDQEYEVYSQRFLRDDLDDGKPFDPKVLPNDYLTDPKPSHTFVYVSTIQRMAINLFGREGAGPAKSDDPERDDEAEYLDIPIHAFDLIIADECHRGYTAQETSVWRETINHFSGVKIGLTATPAAHTVGIFGEPVYRYGVEQAIRDGWLVDYDTVSIKSNVRLQGVFLKEGEEVGRVDTDTGETVFDFLEDEREFAAEKIERDITAPDSNRKIIKEIARYAAEHEERTGRFPKTLIFAVNDLQHTSHADQLVKICREVFARGDEFVKKITGNPNVDRPLQRIREFRNRPNPGVVVTVDMLSTGVDIPALEFIVFLRPVKSRILWEQMLGRGTRCCDAIAKSRLVVFDCFDGTLIRYFKEVSNFQIDLPRKEPLPMSQIIEKIWNNEDRANHVGVLVKRLRRIEKDMTGEARELFARYIPDGDMASFAAGLPGALKKDFTGTMKLLRNPLFQSLLADYPRAKRSFWIAPEQMDEVTSKTMERYGKFDSAEDYLTAFARFVQENADQVDALKVLLQNPKKWRPKVLDTLRAALRAGEFDELKLQKAHTKTGFTALADIISMVKRAASRQEPLFSAEGRVQRAMKEIVKQHLFESEQLQWLELIQNHLATNLALAEEDFDEVPIFEQRGGLGRAKKVFGKRLPALIEEINAAVAS